jgi:uncharacterized protein YdeI (YjbR/CyaY-like superfamily)
MPAGLAEAMVSDTAVRAGWDGLTPSRQKEILRYLANLKSPEAQQRNLEKVLHVLAGGEARYIARSWNSAENE